MAFGGQKNGKRKGFWVHGIRFYSFFGLQGPKITPSQKTQKIPILKKKIVFNAKRSFSVSGRPKNAKSLIPCTGKIVYFAVLASSSQKLPLHKKTQKNLISGTWKIISFAIFWPPKAEIDLLA